jgi:inorganic pyrophosphatase
MHEPGLQVYTPPSNHHHEYAIAMNLDRVTPGNNTPDEINVIIEIPAHSDPVKYEVDKWVRIEGWDDREAAYQEILTSIERFNNSPVKLCF